MPQINSPTPDATTLTKGKIQLAGDLSGTAASPQISAGVVGSSKLATGVPVQIVMTNYAAVATGTATIPVDDTIPQITEGTEFMTQTITPKSATNILIIEIAAFISSSVNQRTISALFQDSAVNGLAVCEVSVPVSTGSVRHVLSYTMTAGTTSATTFRFRVGGEAASTITFNGLGGSRFYGTSVKSSIKITEYKG